MFEIENYFSGSESIEVTTKIPENVKNILNKSNISDMRQLINGTRRIINGNDARNSRPYMVSFVSQVLI